MSFSIRNYLLGKIVLLGALLLLLFSPLKKVHAQFGGSYGAISATLTWGADSLTGGGFFSARNIDTGFSATPNSGFVFPPGTYVVSAGTNPNANDGVYVGDQTISVVGGQTTSVSFDAQQVSGLVKGSIKVNGQNASGEVQFCTIGGHCAFWASDGPLYNVTGNFNIALAPGSYIAHAIISVGNNSIDLGSTQINVTSGQVISDPSIQFNINYGAISASLTWANNNLTNGGLFSAINTDTNYSASPNSGFVFPPGNYIVSAGTHPNANDGVFIGNQNVSVLSGQTSNVQFDAQQVSGLIKGSIKVNGQDANGEVQFCSVGGHCDFWASDGPLYDVNGNFNIALSPGVYIIHAKIISSNTSIDLGNRQITVTIGQVISDSSVQFGVNYGAISTSLSWGTESLTNGGFFSSRNVDTGFIGSPNSGFIFPEGTYIVSAGTNPNANDGVYIGSQTITVVGGQTTNISFDGKAITGLVKGSIKVNGQDANGEVQFCSVGGHCDFWASDGPLYDVTGNFNIALAPGNYIAHARLNISNTFIDLGNIQITVVAGQILDIANNSVIVPVGQNISVTIGGISIIFPEVTTSGYMSLTTTSTAQGGPPPSEYRFLGTYYELTTSAIYTGPVTVKFTYNDSDVHGLESNLKLYHWDGSTWQNITVPPIDTVNNIITGSTTTLSPFVIGEPLYIPVITTVTAPQEPQPINQSVSVSAVFTYNGSLGTYSAVWDWGDGQTSVGTVDQQNLTVSGSHSYASAGVYSLKLVVSRDNGGSSEPVLFHYVVVYNAQGGFVTGGGSINSPAGAYTPDSSLNGKANFGFVSKYDQGATIPTGQTEYQLKSANFNFHSTSYDWLVISGTNAKFKGSGTVNGVGDYAFILSVVDGQASGGVGGKFRIKIWKKDTNQVIYDNENGASDDAIATTPINSGNIVIHN